MRVLSIVLVLLLAAVAALLLFHRAPEGPDPAPEEIAPGRREAASEVPPSFEPLDAVAPATPAVAPTAPWPDGTPAVAGLAGEVVDEASRPLPGALVRLERLDPYVLRGGRADPGALLATGRAEADGRFSLPLATAEWVRVYATHPGYGAAGRRIPGPGGFVRLVLPRAASLRVEVSAADGRPVSDARVSVVAREAVTQERTDENGHARFESLAPGRVQATVAADGYADVRAEPRRVVAGETTTTLLRVVLERAVVFGGRVVDATDGEGIAGAIVHLRAAGRTIPLPPTAADGRFGPVPSAAATESMLVTATAEGYAPVLLPVHVQDPEDGLAIEIALQASEPWRGRVVDGSGQPVAGARVGYTPDGVDSRPPAAATTDRDGSFELPPPPPPLPGRRVILEAAGPAGYAARALRPEDPVPSPSDLVLVLRRGSVVTGRVVGAAGAGAGSIRVRLEPQWSDLPDRSRPGTETSRLLGMNERGRLALTTATDTEGWWRLAAVPDGPYVVRAEAAAATTFGTAAFEVAGADVDTGILSLAGAHVLTGRVRDGAAGAPVPGANVTVVATAPPRRAWETVTGEDEGSFTIAGLAPGSYEVRASLPGARGSAQATVEMPSEDLLDLVLPRGAELEGVLTTGGDRPYRGRFTLYLDHARRARGGRGLRRILDASDDGRFHIDGVPAGEWRVRVTTPDGAVGMHATPLAIRGGAGYDVRIALAAAGGLAGVLRTPDDGAPARGGEIHAKHLATGRTVRATTTAQGRYRFAGLAPGAWRLQARGRGGAPLEEDVDVPSGAVATHDLRLLPAGSLRVVVVAADGTKRAGAIVTARTPGRVTGLLPFATPPRTGPDGSVVVTDLPQGPLVVQARTLRGEGGRVTLTLEGAKTVHVEVEVRAAPR